VENEKEKGEVRNGRERKRMWNSEKNLKIEGRRTRWKGGRE